MPSVVDLVNDALSQIGANPITALDDGSQAANYAKRLYPMLRDAALRIHHWNFAMARAELTASAAKPVSEFTYQYPLPPECLKVIEYNQVQASSLTLVPYRIEGRMLLTDESTVKIVYLTRIENPDVFDSLFYQFLTTWLASKLASAIPKDERKAEALFKIAFQVLLPAAASADGQEGSARRFTVNDLIEVR